MVKLFDADGNEVEAFTQEELEEKKKEALDEYIADNPDKSKELEEAKKELTDAQEAIKKLEEEGNGSKEQKDRLKNKATEAENKLKEVTDSFTQQMKELKDNIFGGKKQKLIDQFSGGDEEIKKKIEFEFDGFKDEPKNEVELEQQLKKAAHIVNGNSPIPNFLDNLSNSTPRGDKQEHKINTQETDNSKNTRNALGISDQDVEKYGKKDN